MRAPMGDRAYWNKRVDFLSNTVKEHINISREPSANPTYRPQFLLNLTQYHLTLMLRRYSRGDSVKELAQYFWGLLDAWELSNKLSDEIIIQYNLNPEQGWAFNHLGTAPQITDAQPNLKTCRDWIFELSDLNHYNWCFWLVGLALSLKIPDEQWNRLLKLIATQGQDILLDRVIASRSPEWIIGTELLHKKPYARLLKAIDAPKEKQALLLKEFVDHWYGELKRKGKQELWWYIYGDPEKHPLSMGSYFGRWCIEAVAAVSAFGLDDELCLDLEHYPSDLLHREKIEMPILSESKHEESRSGLFRKLYEKFKR